MHPVQARRLSDGNRGMSLSTDYASMSLAEKRRLREELGDAACAMQSLDDLGSDEANDSAWRACVSMSDRLRELGALIDSEEREIAARLIAGGAKLLDSYGAEITAGCTVDFVPERWRGEWMTVEALFPPGSNHDTYWFLEGKRSSYAFRKGFLWCYSDDLLRVRP